MKVDIRHEAAKHYDCNPDFSNDIPFYQQLISSPDLSVLELGCRDVIKGNQMGRITSYPNVFYLLS
jgi:hypothetical protein